MEGACVVCSVDNEVITFGQIVNVYTIQHKVLLEVNLLKTLEYSDHVHAYIVTQQPGASVLVWSTQLFHFRVFGLYCNPNFGTSQHKFIVVKYNIK